MSAPAQGFGPRAIWLGANLIFLLAILLAGGTPRYGSPLNSALELVSLPLLLMALALLVAHPMTATVKVALFICAGLLLLPLLQLVPLPPSLWTALPGREFVTDVFSAAKLELAWLPLSLSPPATLRSLLSLFPAIAVFLATLTLRAEERRVVTLFLIGFGILCVPFGLAQVAAGPDSALRLYEVTNASSAVGFFANRNHYAALLYAIMPFIAAWLIHRARAPGSERFVWVALMVVLYGVLILGLGIAASRAGIFLAMGAILASLILAWRRPAGKGNLASRAVLAASLIGAASVFQFGLVALLGRLAHDPLSDGRLVLARVSLRAAADFFPVGAGLGTFVPVYARFETPADMGANYANHAHNDWLELWLEAGVPGLILAAVFLGWFFATAYRAWRHGDAGIDSLLAQAASISVLLLLAHSLADYPLRTPALACVFAFACAMIIHPTGKSQNITKRKSKSGQKLAGQTATLRRNFPTDRG